jgi:hypothetical protein
MSTQGSGCMTRRVSEPFLGLEVRYSSEFTSGAHHASSLISVRPGYQTKLPMCHVNRTVASHVDTRQRMSNAASCKQKTPKMGIDLALHGAVIQRCTKTDTCRTHFLALVKDRICLLIKRTSIKVLQQKILYEVTKASLRSASSARPMRSVSGSRHSSSQQQLLLLPDPGAKTPPQQEHYQYLPPSLAILTPVITRPSQKAMVPTGPIGRNRSKSRSPDRRRSRSIEWEAVDYSKSD